MIALSTIEAVRNLGLEQVIRRYVELKKSGSSWKGKSPFVNENTPSFIVSEGKNIWKCFSTGKGSTGHVSFVMAKNSCSYPEAITEIASQFNIEMCYDDSEDAEHTRKVMADKQKIFDVNFKAWEIFVENLKEINEKVLRTSKQNADVYGVGFANGDFKQIYNTLIGLGFSKKLIEEAGLIKSGDKGIFDVFNKRIVFPIYNEKQIVGFSGRDPNWLKGDKFPKYINTKQTKVFDKSSCLLGIQVAKNYIRNQDKVYLVEGNYDVIAMYDDGGRGNTISPCGTSFTIEHAKAVRKLTKNISIVYDSDRPGLLATKKVIELLLPLDFFIQVVILPDDEDPDSLKDKLDSVIDEFEEDALVWLTKNLWEKAKTIQEKTIFESKLENLLAEIPNAKLRNSYTKLFCQKYKISKSTIEKSIKAVLVSKRVSAERDEPKFKVPNGVKMEEIEEWRFYEINKEGNKQTGYHFLTQGGNFEQLSNFVIKPLFHAYSKTDNKRVLEISNNKVTKIVQVSSKSLNNIAIFEETLVNEGNFYFDGDKKHWLRVRRKILEKFPKCYEIKTLGWQEEGFYSFANGIIDNRFKKISSYGIVDYDGELYFLPALSKINEGLRDDEDDYENEKNFLYSKGKANLKEWSKLFCKVNGENGNVAVCFFISSLFRDLLFSYNSVYPHLFLFGQVQTGKSVCARSLNAIFHKNDTNPFNLTAGTDTGFSRLLAREINSMVWWDEYDNDLKENRYNSLKSAYDGVGRTIGVKSSDNKTKTVKVRSASLISGQYLPTVDDNALFTRSILLTFTKKSTDRTLDEGANLTLLHEMEKQGLSQLIVEILKYRDVIENKYDETIAELFKLFKNDLKGDVFDGRIMQNFILILAPFKILEKQLDLNFSFDEIYKQSIDLILDQTSQINNSDSLATYWKTVEFLYASNLITMNVDFKIETINHIIIKDKRQNKTITFPTAKKCLFIRFTRIQALYAENHRKQHGVNGLAETSIKQYMKSHKGFIGNTPATGFENTKTSAYVFDYDMLPIELEGFAKQKVKSKTPKNDLENNEEDVPFK